MGRLAEGQNYPPIFGDTLALADPQCRCMSFAPGFTWEPTMSDDFDELSPKAFLTRRQLVRFLNRRGFSISFSSIAKYCAPARREGPPTAGVWARHMLYDREE